MLRSAPGHRVAVVLITRNRRPALMHTLSRLLELPERPPLIVVDNGSCDGTVSAVRHACPAVDVVGLAQNLGAAARTVGVRRARTPYVAFCDDDSWWVSGSLPWAETVLDRVPRLAVVAGRILVGPAGHVDAVCDQMEHSPLGVVPGAGPRVLGFVACGSVVRRSAYLEVGGFHPRYGVGGEEALLAIDLAARGWECAYVEQVVARHHPSGQRDLATRRAREVRNDLWTLWLRRRLTAAAGTTARRVLSSAREPAVWEGARQAAAGWHWVLRERQPVDRALERRLGILAKG
jgi:GT2 family glycosyltransferase